MCFLLAVYDSYGNIKLCRLTPQVHINNLCLIQLTSDGRLLNGFHFSVLFLALQFCICYVLPLAVWFFFVLLLLFWIIFPIFSINSWHVQPEKKDMVGMQEQVCILIVLCFYFVLSHLTLILAFRSLSGKSSSCMTNTWLMWRIVSRAIHSSIRSVN